MIQRQQLPTSATRTIRRIAEMVGEIRLVDDKILLADPSNAIATHDDCCCSCCTDKSIGGVIVTVSNPQKKRLKLDLQVTRNNTQPLKITNVSSDTTFTYGLSYIINGQSAENIAFAATLWKEDKKKS